MKAQAAGYMPHMGPGFMHPDPNMAAQMMNASMLKNKGEQQQPIVINDNPGKRIYFLVIYRLFS